MRRALPYVPAVILVAVVLVQRVEMIRHDLIAWMGAGFAMFTTSDDAFGRHVRCIALDGEGAELHVRVAAPREVPDAVRYHPSERALAPVADDFARRRCDAPPEMAGHVARVRVEVWSHAFRPRDATLEARRIAGVERAAPASGGVP